MSSAPRIGVALSSGGAAGMAHVRVLEALTEARIPIHCVAGTSAGAMVGAAYAAGHLAAFRDVMCALTRSRVIRLFDPIWPRSGLLGGRKSLETIRPYIGDRIETLPCPYAAVATDLRSGEEVVLRHGSVFAAIRASVAVPGILAPEHWEGRLLADGGIVNPLPVDVARRLGADLVIAVSVLGLPENPATGIRDDEGLAAQWLPRIFTPRNAAPDHRALELARRSERLSIGNEDLSLFDVLSRATGLAQARIAAGQLRAHPPDCLITVPLPHLGVVDFHRSTEAVAAGRAAALQALPAIQLALAASASFKGRVTRWLNHEEPWPPRQAENSPTPLRLDKGRGSSASV